MTGCTHWIRRGLISQGGRLGVIHQGRVFRGHRGKTFYNGQCRLCRSRCPCRPLLLPLTSSEVTLGQPGHPLRRKLDAGDSKNQLETAEVRGDSHDVLNLEGKWNLLLSLITWMRGWPVGEAGSLGGELRAHVGQDLAGPGSLPHIQSLRANESGDLSRPSLPPVEGTAPPSVVLLIFILVCFIR